MVVKPLQTTKQTTQKTRAISSEIYLKNTEIKKCNELVSLRISIRAKCWPINPIFWKKKRQPETLLGKDFNQIFHRSYTVSDCSSCPVTIRVGQYRFVFGHIVLQVYFLWICPSHKHFEWFIDVLRDVERKDVTNVLEIHIFITQFFHKFDLRTTMLVSITCVVVVSTSDFFEFLVFQYICENHFQRLSKMSMFTGLKAVNHFGRPDMSSFLKFVQKKHSYVSAIIIHWICKRAVN